MALQYKTIDDFCRLCAIESQSGIIIYSTEGENLCLEEKITNCLRIEVSRDDLLPKKVCQLCSELLEDYYRFSERAVQVQQTLGLLLGVHTPCVPPDEMQLCLMQTNVKVESNVIKNELDEINLQHGGIQIESDKFDISLGAQVNSEYDSDEGRKKLILDGFDNRGAISSVNNYNYESRELTDLIIDNVKQFHRRKLSQPKKASCEIQYRDKFELQHVLKEKEEEETTCFINGNSGSQTDFKSEAFNDCELFQDVDKCQNQEQHSEFLEGKVNNTAIEEEWRKNWGIMCNQCGSTFQNKDLFDEHFEMHYNEKPIYTCSFCKESVDKYSEYKSHILNHVYKEQFKCEFCDKKFITKEMLEVHVLTHNDRGSLFICENCGAEFPTKKKLNVHKKKHNAQKEKEFCCPECGKILQTRGGLTAHLTVHKLGRRFMCHLCGKTFTQKINMQQHVKHHKGEKPYTCENCGKSFTEKSHLNRHKSFHTLERPYQCSVCKKMYKTERCLKVHSHVHLNTRPYVCTYCGKGFLSSTKLKQHYNCHTGERPFACRYCERAFTNYPNWLKHTRRRHKVDHKTGLSLKGEQQTQNVTQTNGTTNTVPIANEAIELIEISEVEVKEDGESIGQLSNDCHPHMAQATMAEFHDPVNIQNNLSQFQIHSVPEFFNTQNMYSVHVTPYSQKSCYKEI